MINKIDWDNPENHFPSPNNCNLCRITFQKVICGNITEFSKFPVDQKIAFLSDIINQKMLVKAIFCENDIEFYELQRTIELENLKQQQLTAKEALLSNSETELLALLGLHKSRANSSALEIGKKVGDFFFHTLNSKKQLMFDLKAVDIANLICVLFVSQMGTAFKPRTMEGNVGEGRK